MKGLLLINLGTPADPTPKAVGEYLEQFLMDPNVIGAPEWLRSILVKKIIVPRRSVKSAEKYQSIWTEKGSPLRVNTVEFIEALRRKLPQLPIEYSFRYGEPNVNASLRRLHDQGVKSLHVLPLYPHYADSSVGTAWEDFDRASPRFSFEIKKLDIFYDQDWFLKSWADLIQSQLKNFKADHLLFSYHGIPISHVVRAHPECKKTASQKAGLNCPLDCAKEKCYIGQCRSTSEQIFKRLNLSGIEYSTSFQSRLGPFPWTQPNTVAWIKELHRKGVRRPLVVCPSFVSDCLETLEEIGLGEVEHFSELGGEELRLCPSLNYNEHWVSRFSEYVSQEMELT